MITFGGWALARAAPNPTAIRSAMATAPILFLTFPYLRQRFAWLRAAVDASSLRNP
jgi:hypothetical protein